MRPTVLGLVADDLTGAGDAAAGFAERGWRVVLRLRPGRPIPHADERPLVLAVSTQARAAPDGDAAVLTARAVEAVLAVGAERLYLKIDSTVRGSVAGQIDGALTAWSTRHPRARAVICPAFPGQRRTVSNGCVLVDGVPVTQTAAGTDPVTPRTEDKLAAIVPGAVLGDLHALSDGRLSRLLVDAEDDADLDRLAEALTRSGPELVVVGSGGLAAALGRAWSRPAPRAVGTTVAGRVLIAVSSLHPVTREQLRRLPVDPAQGIDVLLSSTGALTAEAAAADLATRVAMAFATRAYGALVLVGGDGATAALRRLGAEEIVVDGALIPGCPTGIVTGGRADGLRLVTKSGGFGDPTALHDIVAELRRTARRPHAGIHSAEPSPTPKDAP